MHRCLPSALLLLAVVDYLPAPTDLPDVRGSAVDDPEKVRLPLCLLGWLWTLLGLLGLLGLLWLLRLLCAVRRGASPPLQLELSMSLTANNLSTASCIELLACFASSAATGHWTTVQLSPAHLLLLCRR